MLPGKTGRNSATYRQVQIRILVGQERFALSDQWIKSPDWVVPVSADLCRTGCSRFKSTLIVLPEWCQKVLRYAASVGEMSVRMSVRIPVSVSFVRRQHLSRSGVRMERVVRDEF